jgi:dihydroneopterin aldolase
MDRVILCGIQCSLKVGVSPDERREPQACLVDVELQRDLSRPARTDDVRDTIDYSRVFNLVLELSRKEQFALLERFAGRLEEELRRAERFDAVVIRVKKLRPPLPGCLDHAGIEIRRA